MRAIHSQISNYLHTPIAVIERNEPFFNSPFHFHEELELMYIKEGYGKRIIGDKFEQFQPGDLVFVGPNLPHVWLNDDEFYKETSYLRSQSIILYFNKEVFSRDFYDLKESSKINSLIKRAGRGIRVTGKTRQMIAQKLEELSLKKDFEKIIGLLEILHILSLTDEVEYINHEGYEGTIRSDKPERLTEVFNYVTTNFNQNITLQSIARIAYLTPPAFCRLFKQKTSRSFIDYLNEVRISNACKLLMETTFNISEIAFLCGYKTLSNFNKIFKKSTGISPKAYREAVKPKQMAAI